MPEPIYIAGPTGAGKTAVALELARRIGKAEIINGDAFQIYRGIEILSAAPTIAERAEVTHHLFGELSITETCDAAKYEALARAKIAEVQTRAQPIVVGGSGLYLKALSHGLGPTPPGDADLRKQLEVRPLADLIREYQELDPAGAEKTNLKNRRYVTRNLEICLLSGRPASELKSEWATQATDLSAFFLNWEREVLYQRINARTLAMFSAGVVEEIAKLDEISETAARAIGIAEIQNLIAGKMSEAECIESVQQQTRRLAKRQISWFRREPDFDSISLSCEKSVVAVADEILESVGQIR
ncbi:MAG: tRNA (adenosine(37)-N6)-dimethylallyltransferase MiaA [Verrucomicrobiota bacterium]